MKFPKRTRSRLISTAALCAPVVIVLAMRAGLGGGPALAAAANIASPATSAPDAAPAAAPGALSAEQRKAIAWLKSRELPAMMISPMDHPVAAIVRVTEAPKIIAPPVAPTVIAQAPPAPLPRPTTELTLTLISASADGKIATAIINGQRFHVGQEVEPGWTLTAVDSRKGVATLTGPRNTKAEITQNRSN